MFRVRVVLSRNGALGRADSRSPRITSSKNNPTTTNYTNHHEMQQRFPFPFPSQDGTNHGGFEKTKKMKEENPTRTDPHPPRRSPSNNNTTSVSTIIYLAEEHNRISTLFRNLGRFSNGPSSSPSSRCQISASSMIRLGNRWNLLCGRESQNQSQSQVFHFPLMLSKRCQGTLSGDEEMKNKKEEIISPPSPPSQPQPRRSRFTSRRQQSGSTDEMGNGHMISTQQPSEIRGGEDGDGGGLEVTLPPLGEAHVATQTSTSRFSKRKGAPIHTFTITTITTTPPLLNTSGSSAFPVEKDSSQQQYHHHHQSHQHQHHQSQRRRFENTSRMRPSSSSHKYQQKQNFQQQQRGGGRGTHNRITTKSQRWGGIGQTQEEEEQQQHTRKYSKPFKPRDTRNQGHRNGRNGGFGRQTRPSTAPRFHDNNNNNNNNNNLRSYRSPEQQQQQQQQGPSCGQARLSPRGDVFNSLLDYDDINNNDNNNNINSGSGNDAEQRVDANPSSSSSHTLQNSSLNPSPSVSSESQTRSQQKEEEEAPRSRRRFTSRRSIANAEVPLNVVASGEKKNTLAGETGTHDTEQKEVCKNTSRFTKRNSSKSGNTIGGTNSTSYVGISKENVAPVEPEEKEKEKEEGKVRIDPSIVLEEPVRTNTTDASTTTTTTTAVGSSSKEGEFENPLGDRFTYYSEETSLCFVEIKLRNTSDRGFLFPQPPLFKFEASSDSVKVNPMNTGIGAEGGRWMQEYASRQEEWNAFVRRPRKIRGNDIEIPFIPPSPQALANFLGTAMFIHRAFRLSVSSRRSQRAIWDCLAIYWCVDERGEKVLLSEPEHMAQLMSAESVTVIVEAATVANMFPLRSALVSYAIMWLHNTFETEMLNSSPDTAGGAVASPSHFTPELLARCTLHLVRLWQSMKVAARKGRVGKWRSERRGQLIGKYAPTTTTTINATHSNKRSFPSDAAICKREEDEAIVHSLLINHLLPRLVGAIEVIARSPLDKSPNAPHGGLGLSQENVVALSTTLAALQKAVTLRLFNFPQSQTGNKNNSSGGGRNINHRKIDSRLFWHAIHRFAVSDPSYMYSRDVALSVAQFVTHTHTIPSIVTRADPFDGNESTTDISKDDTCGCAFVHDSPEAIANSVVRVMELVMSLRVVSTLYPQVTFFDSLTSLPGYQEAYDRLHAHRHGRTNTDGGPNQPTTTTTTTTAATPPMLQEYVSFCKERAAQRKSFGSNNAADAPQSISQSEPRETERTAVYARVLSLGLAEKYKLKVEPYLGLSSAYVAPYRTFQVSNAATIYARILTHRKLHASIVSTSSSKKGRTHTGQVYPSSPSSSFSSSPDYSAVEWMAIVESLLWKHADINPYASLAFFCELSYAIVLRSTMSDTTTLFTAFGRIYSSIIAHEKKKRGQEEDGEEVGNRTSLSLDGSKTTITAPADIWRIEMTECFLSAFVDQAIQVTCNFMTLNGSRPGTIEVYPEIPGKEQSIDEGNEEGKTNEGEDRWRRTARFLRSPVQRAAEKKVGGNRKVGESVLSGSEFQLLLEAVQNVMYFPHVSLQLHVLHFIEVVCKKSLFDEDRMQRGIQNEMLLAAGRDGNSDATGAVVSPDDNRGEVYTSLVLSKPEFVSLVRFLFRHPPIPAVDLFSMTQLKLKYSTWLYPVVDRIAEAPPSHSHTHSGIGEESREKDDASGLRYAFSFTTEVGYFMDHGSTQIIAAFVPASETVDDGFDSSGSTRVTKQAMETYQRILTSAKLLRMEEYCLTLQAISVQLHATHVSRHMLHFLLQCSMRILFDAPYSTSIISLIQFLSSASRLLFDPKESQMWLREMSESPSDTTSSPLLFLEAVVVSSQRILLLLEREGNQVGFTDAENDAQEGNTASNNNNNEWVRRLLTSPTAEFTLDAPFTIPSGGTKLWSNSLETLVHALVMLEHAAPVAKQVNDALHLHHGPYAPRAGVRSFRGLAEMATRSVCFLHRYLKLAFCRVLAVDGSGKGLSSALSPNRALVDDFELARLITSFPDTSSRSPAATSTIHETRFRTSAYLSEWMVPYLCAKERLFTCDRALAAVFLPYVISHSADDSSNLTAVSAAAENAADKLIAHSRRFSHIVYFLVDVQEQCGFPLWKEKSESDYPSESEKEGHEMATAIEGEAGDTQENGGHNQVARAVLDRLITEAIERLRSTGSINDIVRLLTYYGSYDGGSVWQRVLDEAIPTELVAKGQLKYDGMDANKDDNGREVGGSSGIEAVVRSAQDAAERWSYGLLAVEFHRNLPLRFRTAAQSLDGEHSTKEQTTRSEKDEDEEEEEDGDEQEGQEIRNGSGFGVSSGTEQSANKGGKPISNLPMSLWSTEHVFMPYALQFLRSLRRRPSHHHHQRKKKNNNNNGSNSSVLQRGLDSRYYNLQEADVQRCSEKALFFILTHLVSDRIAIQMQSGYTSFLVLEIAIFVKNIHAVSHRLLPPTTASFDGSNWLLGRLGSLIAHLFVKRPLWFEPYTFFSHVSGISSDPADIFYFCCAMRKKGPLGFKEFNVIVQNVVELEESHSQPIPAQLAARLPPPPSSSRGLMSFLQGASLTVSSIASTMLKTLGSADQLSLLDCIALMDRVADGSPQPSRHHLEHDEQQSIRSITSAVFPIPRMFSGGLPFRTRYAAVISAKLCSCISHSLFLQPTSRVVREDDSLWADYFETIRVDHFTLAIHSIVSDFMYRAFGYRTPASVPLNVLEELNASEIFRSLRLPGPIQKWEELALASILHISPSRLQRSLGTMDYIRWMNMLLGQLQYLPRSASLFVEGSEGDTFAPWVRARLDRFRDVARSRVNLMFHDLQRFIEDECTIVGSASPYQVDVSVLMAWCETEYNEGNGDAASQKLVHSLRDAESRRSLPLEDVPMEGGGERGGGVGRRTGNGAALYTQLPEYRVLSISMAALSASQVKSGQNGSENGVQVEIANVSSLLQWASACLWIRDQGTPTSAQEDKEEKKNNSNNNNNNSQPRTSRDEDMEASAELVAAHWEWEQFPLVIPWKEVSGPLERARSQLAYVIAESLWDWLCEPEPSIAVGRVESMRPIDLSSIIRFYSAISTLNRSTEPNPLKRENGDDENSSSKSNDDDEGHRTRRSSQTIKLVIETLTAQLPACSGEDLVSVVCSLEELARGGEGEGEEGGGDTKDTQRSALALSTRSLLARIPLLLATDTSAFEQKHLFEMFDRLHRLQLVSRASVDAVLENLKTVPGTGMEMRTWKSVNNNNNNNSLEQVALSFQDDNDDGGEDVDVDGMADLPSAASVPIRGTSFKGIGLERSSETQEGSTTLVVKPRVVRRRPSSRLASSVHSDPNPSAANKGSTEEE